MTPLFREIEKTKETCARLALENAALTALIPQLKAENGKLKSDLLELEKKIADVDVLRERDTFFAKEERAKMYQHMEEVSSRWSSSWESNRGDVAKQRAEDAIAHAEAMRLVRSRVDSLASHEAEHNEARTVEIANVVAALTDAEHRAEAARATLREEWASQLDAVRADAGREASSVAARFGDCDSQLASVRAHFDTRCDDIARAVEEAAEESKRALEALTAKLNSTLLRLDRQQRDARTAFEDHQSESTTKLSEAQEARSQMETRVVLVESRLEQLERTVAAAQRER